VTAASLAVQLLNGLASASSLFLVAAGLTLIFGVTRVVNFAHGSLAMLGAYVAWSIGEALSARLGDSAWAFAAAVLGAVLVAAIVGALIESVVLKRLVDAPELLQLTATFAIVLIVRDVVLAIWGAEDLLGPRVPGLDEAIALGSRSLPEYDAFLIVVGPIVLGLLTLLVRKTRFGVRIRAAAENRVVTAALGIDQAKLYTAVFALGAGLAGLAGALQLPREPANLGIDLNIIADAFVVTVVGGLGSIPGAFVAALVIGLVKALCIALGVVEVAGISIAFPKLTLVAEFVVMAVVLAVRPHGLFGEPLSLPPTTPLPEQRALVVDPNRRDALVGLGIALAFVVVPLLSDEYARILATDIAIAALFAASLRFLMGPGGLASFGHAAYFGVGAYAAALVAKSGASMAVALVAAPAFALLAALVFGWFCVRLSGVYLAMLTLAFAQITWSVAFQWDAVTGGSNGIVGVWPPAALADRTRYSWLTIAIVAAALFALARMARSPFGRALRGARDAPLRAEAVGIDVRGTRWAAFALAGAFAGLAGGLYAYSKGSISPETLAIPRSVDALIAVLLGGLNATFGPVLGAAIFTWGQDALARATDYWRAALGIAMLVIVVVVPQGLGGLLAALAPRRKPA
jgi:branched-chain amino acid transport system permease protein